MAVLNDESALTAEMLRIEGQPLLQALQRVNHHGARQIEDQQPDGILDQHVSERASIPHARYIRPLQRRAPSQGEVGLPLHHIRDVDRRAASRRE